MRRIGTALAAGLFVGSIAVAVAAPAFAGPDIHANQDLPASATPSPDDSPTPDPSDPNHVTHPYDGSLTERQNTAVDAAATSLQRNPPFYQAPRAPLAIDPSQIEDVIYAINNAGTPVYEAILAGSADGARGTAQDLHRTMGLPGTYLVIIGTVYDAFSTEIDAQPVLTRAYVEAHNSGTAAVLIRFAELSGEQALGTVDTPDLIAWRPTLIFVGGVLVVGFGYLFIRSRLEKEDESEEQPPPPGAVDLPSGS